MTYWIAWKRGPFGYIVADSAVTIHGAVTTVPPSSSFGELHIVDPVQRKTIAEQALKVSEGERYVYVFSGDVELGEAIGRGFRRRVDAGLSIEMAFANAVAAAGPFSSRQTVHAAVTFHDRGHARILEARTTIDGKVVEVDAVDSGPLPEHLKTATRRIPHMLSRTGLAPEQDLICAVAILQSLSVHEYILAQGVGGVWFGLGVGPDGVVPCPSCCYSVMTGSLDDPSVDLQTDKLVAVFPQNHFTVLRVGKAKQRPIFVDRIWQQMQGANCKIAFDWTVIEDLVVDYVVFIRIDRRQVAVLQDTKALAEKLGGQTLFAFRLVDRKPTIEMVNELASVAFPPRDVAQNVIGFSFVMGSADTPNKYESLSFDLRIE